MTSVYTTTTKNYKKVYLSPTVNNGFGQQYPIYFTLNKHVHFSSVADMKLNEPTNE